MDNSISRQAAIDAICKHGTDLERRGITVLSVANHKQVTVDLLERLPSAQPSYTDEQIQKMQEIEQAEIEKAFQLGREDAQSEIIRCKDCKHSEPFYRDKSRCFLWYEKGIDVFDDGFCNYAKRREERTDG